MTIARKHSDSSANTALPHNGFSLISNDKLLQLYTTMLKCRMLEERIRGLSERDGSVAIHAQVNQEATVVGVGLDLLVGDTLAPAPRGFIPCFVTGLPLESIFAQSISASATGSPRARVRYASFNLIRPSLGLGAQLEKAIGAAIENKRSRNKKITVAFCGDGSTSPQILEDAMRQAAKRKLPILLVCQSAPEAEAISAQARDCGVPEMIVDGDDAVAVYRVATEAIAHARRGSGPTLIDCKPWVVAGLKIKGRRAAGSPILKMEQYLTRKGLFDKKLKSAVTRSFRRELDAATTLA